jgi:hypothetical protein
VPHLELYPHHRGPLDVVGLGEGRLHTVGTDVPDNGMDPAVTMVPVRGGRAASPVKAAISVDPAVGSSAPVWAAAAIRGTTAVPPPLARSAACSRAATLACLSSSSVPSSAETELLVLLPGRASSSGAAARAASAAAAASTLPLLSVSPSPTLPSLPPSLRSLSPLAHVPLPRQPQPLTGAACSRRPSAETVLRIWRASGGVAVWVRGGMSRNNWCSCCRLRNEGGMERG